MADNRKVLVAKRRGERSKTTNLEASFRNSQELSNSKRGTKRPNDTPKKNLANDRLKRLRTSLSEQAQKPCSGSSKSGHNVSGTSDRSSRGNNSPRKRPQDGPYEQAVTAKVVKESVQSRTNVCFKEGHSKDKSIFTNHKVDSLRVSDGKEIQKFQDDIEDMEWSTTDDDLSVNESTSQTPTFIRDKDKGKFCIVVDTNIFLSYLHVVKNIVTVNITGHINPVIFIPWIVIEELDFIKDNPTKSDLKYRAQNAVKYVEYALKEKCDRMKGQSLADANAQPNTGKGQDNKIIASCLQVLEKYERMILLTADVNLRNKARLNNIPACSHTEIMAKIQTLNENKAEVIQNKMIDLCKTVILECAQNAYGPACKKMPICQSPPNSLQDCIFVFLKYWMPVFEEVLMKQFKKSIQDLSAFLSRNESIMDGSNEINELLRLCVRVCLFLKDVDCCKDFIEDTIRDLNNIKEL